MVSTTLDISRRELSSQLSSWLGDWILYFNQNRGPLARRLRSSRAIQRRVQCDWFSQQITKLLVNSPPSPLCDMVETEACRHAWTSWTQTAGWTGGGCLMRKRSCYPSTLSSCGTYLRKSKKVVWRRQTGKQTDDEWVKWVSKSKQIIPIQGMFTGVVMVTGVCDFPLLLAYLLFGADNIW